MYITFLDTSNATTNNVTDISSCSLEFEKEQKRKENIILSAHCCPLWITMYRSEVRPRGNGTGKL